MFLNGFDLFWRNDEPSGYGVENDGQDQSFVEGDEVSGGEASLKVGDDLEDVESGRQLGF